MDVSPLAKKLRLQNARQALILDAPEGYLELLGEVPAPLQFDGQVKGKYDFVHLFVKDRAALDQAIDQALAVVEYDALLWISYPKGSSGIKTDLNRDRLWEALAGRGIRPVTQVSVDDTWSAMRFRPTEAVGN